MKPGDVILTPLPQADGVVKNRPALFLCALPPFDDALVCGISTKLHQYVPGFDEIITQEDEDFVESGLIAGSLIRLGFITVIPNNKLMGSIGSISSERHKRLLKNLSNYLLAVA